jgi:hypothetical protein
MMTQFGVFLCAEQQKTYRREVSGLEERRVGLLAKRQFVGSYFNIQCSVAFVGLELAVEEIACFSRFNWELRFHRN